MISRRIKSDESPRTPPPSKVSTRGIGASADIDVHKRFRQVMGDGRRIKA